MWALPAFILCFIIMQTSAWGESEKENQWRQAAGETVTTVLPFIALIKTFNATKPTDTSNACAGAIIAHNMVITTANCVVGAVTATLMAGSTDSASTVSTIGVQVVRSSSIIIHEEFYLNSMENDIALIIVSPSFNFADPKRIGVIPIAKPTQVDRDMLPRFPLTIAGWGTCEGGNTTTMLKMINRMNVLKQQECDTLGKGMYYKLPMQAFCANTVNGVINGVCVHALSSLAYTTIDDTPSLVGLASDSADDKCPSTKPYIFTRTSSYINWLSTKGFKQ